VRLELAAILSPNVGMANVSQTVVFFTVLVILDGLAMNAVEALVAMGDLASTVGHAPAQAEASSVRAQTAGKASRVHMGPVVTPWGARAHPARASPTGQPFNVLVNGTTFDLVEAPVALNVREEIALLSLAQ